MANINAAIRQVRRARRRHDDSPRDDLDRYRPEYEAILAATADLAGDAAFDDLEQWMVETTRERKRLPPPGEVRRRARELCGERGVTVPEDSPLRG